MAARQQWRLHCPPSGISETGLLDRINSGVAWAATTRHPQVSSAVHSIGQMELWSALQSLHSTCLKHSLGAPTLEYKMLWLVCLSRVWMFPQWRLCPALGLQTSPVIPLFMVVSQRAKHILVLRVAPSVFETWDLQKWLSRVFSLGADLGGWNETLPSKTTLSEWLRRQFGQFEKMFQFKSVKGSKCQTCSHDLFPTRAEQVNLTYKLSLIELHL